MISNNIKRKIKSSVLSMMLLSMLVTVPAYALPGNTGPPEMNTSSIASPSSTERENLANLDFEIKDTGVIQGTEGDSILLEPGFETAEYSSDYEIEWERSSDQGAKKYWEYLKSNTFDELQNGINYQVSATANLNDMFYRCSVYDENGILVDQWMVQLKTEGSSVSPEIKPEDYDLITESWPEEKVMKYICQEGDELKFTPNISVHGNSKNYRVRWYHSKDLTHWTLLSDETVSKNPEMKYEFTADRALSNTYYCVELINEAGISREVALKLIVNRRQYELLPGMPTFIAGQHVEITPDITLDGYTENYTIKWYEQSPGETEWKLVRESTVDEDPDLSYDFYADTEDTFTKYRYELINDAGTVRSKEYEIGVIEDFIVKDNTLYINSTGYLPDIESQNKAFNMNNYSGRLEGRQPWFNKKDKIYKAEIADNILSVGDESFKEVAALERVKLGNDIETIGKSAFYGATSLKGIIIPRSGRWIDEKAFYGCESLMDIYCLSKSLNVYDNPDVIPERVDDSDQSILALPENEDLVKNQHGKPTIYGYGPSDLESWANRYGRNFISISDSNNNLIEWKYTINEETQEIEGLYTDSDPVGEVYIPKSIDGYVVKTLKGRTKSAETNVSMFNEIIGEEANRKITALHIPDSVEKINENTFGDLTKLEAVYNYSKKAIEMNDSLFGNGQDTSVLWVYSPNYTFEENVDPNFQRRFFDKGTLSGTTGDLIWTINPTDKTLELSGIGSSANYKEDEETPWLWAEKYINTIIIKSGVNRLGDYLYNGLSRINRIMNYSSVLESVSDTAFNEVGFGINLNKRCSTTLSNRFVEVVKAINDENEEIEDFKFTFIDTKGSVGTGVTFDYIASEKILQISGNGAMNAYPKDEVPGNTVSETVPWYCGREFIEKIIIDKGVTELSNNSFNEMPNLKEVYNYAKNQTIVGGNDNLFDVIDRFSGKDGESVEIDILRINKKDGITEQEQKENFIDQVQYHGWNITLNDIENVSLKAGLHVINKNLPENLVIEAVRKDGVNHSNAPEYQEKYIVPVYTFADENQGFVDAVPQPEEKGYRLENIFREKGQCGDNLTWWISKENKLIIEGTGDMWNFNRGDAPWAKYVTEIIEIEYADQMTSVGDYAFEGMIKIADFSGIPRSVKRIGTGAFKDCEQLYIFTINKEVTELGSGAFAGCENIRLLAIEDKTRFILEDGVLFNADKTEILGYLREYLYEDIDKKEHYEREVEYLIPEGVKTIGELSFYENLNIESMTIPKSVSNIGDYAFENARNLRKIRNEYDGQQITGTDILLNAGDNYMEKTAIAFKVNTNFVDAATAAGYEIVYLDDILLNKVSAVYQGGPVTLYDNFDATQVVISIIFANGQSTNIIGTDPRISFSGREITKIGDNFFTATYNDGYGNIIETNEFAVEGMNGVKSVEFVYRGASVWFGDSFNKDDIQATLTFADKSRQTIKGSDPRLTYDKQTIDIVGDNEIIVTYNDGINPEFIGKIVIPGKNFLREIKAEYKGDPVELSSGVNDLDLANTRITLTWSDGTSERTNGGDSRISIYTENAMTDEYLVFQAECLENNRDGLLASFAVPYVSNIREVDFEYVGQPVTQNAPIVLGDIELTLTFSDGSTRKVRGDSVSGLSGDPLIQLYADASTTVNLTYQTEGQTFTGSVDVPGKLRLPIKLYVVQRPKKTVYEDGEVFEPDGMIVNCLFDNGEVLDVTERTQIEGGDIISADAKIITLVYEDPWSHSMVKTNMSVNVNQNQKDLYDKMAFKEQYEITKVMFRSKATEDDTFGKTENPDAEDEEDEGKWVDITPDGNNSVSESAALAAIKAGYGFEIKVYTKYRTNRGGEEFEHFLRRAQWDEGFANNPDYAGITDINTKWRYLNDIYPQYTPTANPDILYLRIINNNLESGGTTDIITGESGTQDFIVLERTDVPENGEEQIDSGEWYNSTKIFEFPERDVFGDGTKTRRLYISKDAANPNTAFTDYGIQIVSPAWYGYEPEPEYDFGSEAFKYIEDQKDEDGNPRQKYYTYSQYLHICTEFKIRVTMNDDLHTHILQ